MGRELTEELRRDLQELSVNAQYIERYADFLLQGLRRLQSAAANAQSSLTNDSRANDAYRDNAREVIAMKYEIGRLCDKLQEMTSDCENA